jgi:hypothetical protein
MKVFLCILAFSAFSFSSCSLLLPGWDSEFPNSDFKNNYQIAGFKDPAYQGRFFKNVVVFADTTDLPMRYRLESGVSEILLQNGINAIAGHTYFAPTREWTLDDKKRFFAENKIASYLVISVKGVEVKEYFVPEKITTTRTAKTEKTITGKDTTRRSKKQDETELIKTEKTGGYTEKSTRIDYEARLFNVENGDVIWLSRHVGNDWTFHELLANRLMFDNLFYVLKRQND